MSFLSRWVIGCGILVLILSGCDQQSGTLGRSPRGRGDYASRRIANTSLGEAQASADRVFRQHFRVDRDQSSASVWVARPTEVEDERGERVRDLLTPSPSRRRQLAELRLTDEGNGVLARVRVVTERLDTTERVAFAAERGDDRPAETSIDRTGRVQRQEEWVEVGRDRALEREILDALMEESGETQPAGG